MKICLSHILAAGTPSYGNRDRVFVKMAASIAAGDTANSSCWILSSNHLGTHIDVPQHFSNDGLRTYEIPVEDYFFSAVALVDIPCEGACLIGPEDLDKAGGGPSGADLLLIRTGFEQKRGCDAYWNDNPGLHPELADHLRLACPKLRCVGFDFISITSWKFRAEGRAAHRAFLCPADRARPLLAIEDMKLSLVRGSLRSVVVAPLLVEDGNGGPVTVFADV
jgi:arylformamidase